MNLRIDTEIIFLLIGLGLGLTTSVVLFFSRQNRFANRVLALLVLVFMGALTHNLLLSGGIYDQRPDLYFLPVIARLAIGPLLWLYTASITGLRLRPLVLILLFIPVLAELSIYTYGFQLAQDDKFTFWGNVFGPYVRPIETWLGNVLLATFLVLSFLRLRHWKKLIADQRSDIATLSYRWLVFILAAFSLLLVITCIWEALPKSMQTHSILSPTDLIRSLLIVTLGWFGLRQHRIELVAADQLTPEVQNVVEQSELVERIAPDLPTQVIPNTPFDPKILEQIQHTMQTQELFLDAELTIFKLAAQCALPTKLVSLTINQGTGKTFLAFVNSYRVEAVKQRLHQGDQRNLTLLAIAFDCGFNSKSTFNRVFREQTGQSPSDFSEALRG